MSRLFTYCLLLILLATKLVYATTGKTCLLSTLSHNCHKAVHSLGKSKIDKSHSAPKIQNRHKSPGKGLENTPSSADTFEKFIAPFIETVAPHFYDKIIKKEEKKVPDTTSACKGWS